MPVRGAHSQRSLMPSHFPHFAFPNDALPSPAGTLQSQSLINQRDYVNLAAERPCWLGPSHPGIESLSSWHREGYMWGEWLWECIH